MSADNFIGVRENNGKWEIYDNGCMSFLCEDCQYPTGAPDYVFDTRAEALVKAHDLVQQMYVCEYGVIEIGQPGELCGQNDCYRCGAGVAS